MTTMWKGEICREVVILCDRREHWQRVCVCVVPLICSQSNDNCMDTKVCTHVLEKFCAHTVSFLVISKVCELNFCKKQDNCRLHEHYPTRMSANSLCSVCSAKHSWKNSSAARNLNNTDFKQFPRLSYNFYSKFCTKTKITRREDGDGDKRGGGKAKDKSRKAIGNGRTDRILLLRDGKGCQHWSRAMPTNNRPSTFLFRPSFLDI